jgi:transposase-like protein
MPRPRFCRNPECRYAYHPPPKWLVRAGFYLTDAHGMVQRYRCKRCGKWMGDQTESMHYYAKRRLDLAQILSRVRGGSSLRDIAREMGCSRTAVASAVVRLGRQAMASHVDLLTAFDLPGAMVFDGLVSAVTSHDYPSQIQTLVDRSVELVLAMTHYVGERGGRRTRGQQKRIERKRAVWRPTPGALKESICLLVNELPRFAGLNPITVDTDENPLYAAVIGEDLAMRWHEQVGRLKVRRTSSLSPRTTGNPLFAVNYVDRMIRHRIKEHTRESIAVGRNSTMQMLRMWIFAWDHNMRQPYRVNDITSRCRAIEAGVSEQVVNRLKREFYTRRRSVRQRRIPESIEQVWLGRLETPPVRWAKPQTTSGPVLRQYAIVDLELSKSAR